MRCDECMCISCMVPLCVCVCSYYILCVCVCVYMCVSLLMSGHIVCVCVCVCVRRACVLLILSQLNRLYPLLGPFHSVHNFARAFNFFNLITNYYYYY